jgi:hypothetical protein
MRAQVKKARMGEIELSSGATSAYAWAPGAPYAEASGYAWGDNPAWGSHNEPMWREEANLAERLQLSGCMDTNNWHDGVANLSGLELDATLYAEEQIIEHGNPGLYLYNQEKGRTCSSYLMRQTCIAPVLFFDIGGPEMRDLAGSNASLSPCVVDVDKVGERFKYPEDNCCVCGKGMEQKICSDEIIAHTLRQQHVLKSRIRAWFRGLSVPQTREQTEQATRNLLTAEGHGLIEKGAAYGRFDSRVGLDAVEMSNWFLTGRTNSVRVALIALSLCSQRH